MQRNVQVCHIWCNFHKEIWPSRLKFGHDRERCWSNVIYVHIVLLLQSGQIPDPSQFYSEAQRVRVLASINITFSPAKCAIRSSMYIYTPITFKVIHACAYFPISRDFIPESGMKGTESNGIPPPAGNIHIWASLLFLSYMAANDVYLIYRPMDHGKARGWAVRAKLNFVIDEQTVWRIQSQALSYHIYPRCAWR